MIVPLRKAGARDFPAGHLAAALCAAFLSSLAPAPAADGLPAPRIVMDNHYASVADLLRCLHGRTTLVSAHRGGPSPGYPESALETFAHTLSQMPAMVETDVRTTSDGVVVLMHDETIDRTTDGRGTVSSLTWEALSQVHLKDNDGTVTAFHVPRLSDALQMLRGRGMVALDMKEGANDQAVAAVIRLAEAEPFASVIAYSIAQAKAFHEANADITIIYPVDTNVDIDALIAAGIPANRLMAWTGIQAQKWELWRYAHERAIPVVYGTLFFSDYAMKMTGNTSHYAYLARHGVDVLPTDYAATAFNVIDAEMSTAEALRACHAGGTAR